MEELKRCRCGSDNVHIVISSIMIIYMTESKYKFICHDCGNESEAEETREKAVARWNLLNKGGELDG